MRIAIVAPSPTPFVVGGAEKLWWGLQRHINEQTQHHCELFKIPINEQRVIDLLQAYQRCFELDLATFDRVISTKYPAFMVQHPDHHLYLQHLLRGCYDTYPAELDNQLPWSDPLIAQVLHEISREDIALKDIFAELFALFGKRPDDSRLHQLPGPFIRFVLHLLDRRAMEGVRCFSAISRTVKERRDYFPPAAEVTVIHHPSNLVNFAAQPGSYLFTASRLDRPKRVDLLIRGYQQSHSTLPLIIAGSGPQESALKELAGNDPRIRFVGFVSDRELEQYYAAASAVLFAPEDEDYGLITVEALSCGKPLITCSDSGGVTELIRHGENGLISEPRPAVLAAAIDSLDQLQGPQLEHNCRQSVTQITWGRVCDHLLSNPPAPEQPGPRRGGSRKRLLAVSTYPLFPLASGGQLRLYHLLRRLSCRCDITLLSLNGAESRTTSVAPHLVEHCFAESPEFATSKKALEERLGISATDIAFMQHDQSLPEFTESFQHFSARADQVMCIQPYSYPLVKRYYSGPLIYDAHNVEYLLKRDMARHQDQELLAAVYSVEAEICAAARTVLVCSSEDRQTFADSFGVAESRLVSLPNGVDAFTTPFLTRAEAQQLKRSLGIDRPLAIFIGSGHPPNVDAAAAIVAMARQCPEVAFIIIGSVAQAFARRHDSHPGADLPANVGFAGVLDSRRKSLYLQLADIALNPMLEGGGSNLKLAEYMAAGIAVISTPVGVRGYQVEDAGLVDVVALEDFSAALHSRLSGRDQLRLTQARDYIIKHHDWNAVLNRLFRDGSGFTFI